MIHTKEFTIGQETISLETGNWAKQADGSIVYRCGKLVLLATVCATKSAKEGQDFFPLTCEYVEKLYSVGKIPGGYIKRESKPSEHEILISRIIDRPIRPLFPEGYFCEVQLIVQVLSSDKSISIHGHALTAASAALSVSDIPFNGSIAAVRVGRINGELVANPKFEEMDQSDLDIVVAGSKDSIVMIEGESKEISNKDLMKTLEFAQVYIKKMVEFQEEFIKPLGIKKRDVELRHRNEELFSRVKEHSFKKMSQANQSPDKLKRAEEIAKIYEETTAFFKNQEDLTDEDQKNIKNFLHEIESEIVRDAIFKDGIRPDGRKKEEIRKIDCAINVLPGVHGSSVFTRGQTQSLGVMTLGTVSDGQRFENLQGQKEKLFMLHYNFPAFSVGEVKRSGSPGRREIGHGNLAERAIKQMLPDFNEFPYVIRLVSEILESNGSSSMASVCSGSLALMSGGVPLKAPVGGIAMGLITGNSGDVAILSDIAGIEDHFGDMDFKLAGTSKGITACQMDLKVYGLGLSVLEKVIQQAEEGRNHILNEMAKVIQKPADKLSDNAPRITIKMIPKDRIGELIGPGGKTIRSIIEQSKAEINIDDSGKVTIASPDSSSSQKALEIIEAMFAEIEVGKIYKGLIKRITDFGAFIEILPGREGLCHISKLDTKRVNDVRDIVSEGEVIQVKVLGIDKQGKIDLSRKDALGGN